MMYFGHGKSNIKFCSQKCSTQSQDNKVTLVCPVCKKKFRLSPCIAARPVKNKCCSSKCSYEIRRATRGFRKKIKSGHRTGIEQITEDALKELGITYVWESRFGRYWVDFYIPEKHLAIECDEPYWHTPERDAARDQYLNEKYNLPVVRFTTNQIKGDILGLLSNALIS